jgi:hypothetical protein
MTTTPEEQAIRERLEKATAERIAEIEARLVFVRDNLCPCSSCPLSREAIPFLLSELRSRDSEVKALWEALSSAAVTLAFYADPFDALEMDGTPIRVPDFYDELDFGWRAAEEMNRARALLPERKGE